MAAPTLLLDTNVWNYIIDADGVEAVRKSAKANRVAIVACPAVAFESLRVPDPKLRKRRAKALAREDWTRVMPEAFSEAEDFRAEVARLRPEWQIASPQLQLWYANRSDWQSGFWKRVRDDSAGMAEQIAAVSHDRLEQARAETVSARKQAQSLGHTLHTFKWNRARATFYRPTPGWDGEEFEAWRAQSVATWWRELVEGKNQTTLDWLGPWIDIPEIRRDPASWTRFWTRDADVTRLPREWIRWAMAEAQATRATSRGTPGDNQLATYLIDVDIFLTNDKVFVDLVEAMRPHSPAQLAQVRRVSTGDAALTDVLATIEGVSQ